MRWDGRESVFVSINADLKTKMCGLCGLNDGDKTNDFKTSQGATVTNANIATFGNSWKEGGEYTILVSTTTGRKFLQMTDTGAFEFKKLTFDHAVSLFHKNISYFHRNI